MTRHLLWALLLATCPAVGQATQPAANEAATTPAIDADTEAAAAPVGAEADASAAAALEAELLPMLDARGLPRGADRGDLVDLAARANRLGRSTPAPEAKLQTSQVEMRIYNALAQQAIAGDRPGEASLRVAQLRSAARQTQELTAPDADVIAAFWLLHADLTDINRNARTLASRQSAAIERLQRFVDAVPEDHPLAIEGELALLRLATQAGNVATVRDLLPKLSNALPGDDRRRAHLDPARRMLTTLDRPAPTVPGVPFEGRAVLLAFHRQPTLDPAVREAQQLWKAQGLEVATVTLQPAPEGMDWPGPLVWDPALFPAYGIQATPAYVLVIDGRIASVAATPAIVHQVPAALQQLEPFEAPDPAADPAAQP